MDCCCVTTKFSTGSKYLGGGILSVIFLFLAKEAIIAYFLHDYINGLFVAIVTAIVAIFNILGWVAIGSAGIYAIKIGVDVVLAIKNRPMYEAMQRDISHALYLKQLEARIQPPIVATIKIPDAQRLDR